MRHLHHPLGAALLGVALATPTALAQVDAETFAAIRREGLEQSRVMEILDRLTNDVGHRLTGSANFTRACEWARDRFAAFGVDQVELEHWGTWPVGWNRGQWMGRVVSPEPLELQVATEAWTNGTAGRVRGPVLAMPADSEALAALDGELDGAWLYGRMPSRRRAEFRAELLGTVTGRIAGFLYPSRGDRRYPNRMRVFGRPPRTPDVAETPPRIMIRRDQADRLEELLQGEEPVIAEFDVRNRWRREPVALHNVIAEIRGSDLPEEVVYVCGHLDSWHQATGTTDNGTGTASTLEVARILTAIGAQPRRTIRFALWGGEEQGLLGSRKHVVMRRTSMPLVSAVLNHDTGTNWAHALRVNEAAVPLFERVTAPLEGLTAPDADHEGPVFEVQGVEQLQTRGGSDHASFLGAGVPAFAWRLTGRSDYFRFTWHTQWDTFDVAIPEYMRHNATVIATVALGLANAEEMVPRDGVPRAEGDDLQPILEGILGIELTDDDPLRVEAVDADGRGAKLGLRPGDRFAAIRGEAVDDLVDLRVGLRRSSGDDEAPTLTVVRDGEKVALRLDG